MAEDEKASKTLEPTEEPNEDLGEDPTDRYVSLAVRYGLPVVTVAAALVIGFLTSIGPAILTLVTGVLLGAIALLWASLRSLVGDDKLDPALDEAAAVARAARGGLRGERKRIALRALKDLEHEHNIGKIDDDDYERLVTHYRSEAKAAMREMDDELEPYRAKAEKLAQEHLDKKLPKRAKKAPKPEPVAEPVTEPEDERDDEEAEESPKPVAAVPAPEPAPVARPKCAKCGTRNDADAAFCKKCGKVLKEPPPDEDSDEEEEDG
ncbi:MAG TPA: zinc ribbon domain-containing protein [Polyangiaceae bacterium]